MARSGGHGARPPRPAEANASDPSRSGRLRALRHASAARRGARRPAGACTAARSTPGSARAAPDGSLDARGRGTLPEVFLPPEERIPESFWISLRYFNYYRIALAAVFVGTALIYDDAVNLGANSLELFRYFAGGYLLCAVVLHALAARPAREVRAAGLAAGVPRHRRDHAAHVRERRYPERPRRDAAHLAHRRGDRGAAAAHLPLRRARHRSRCCSSRATGCSSTTRRPRASCSRGCSRSATSPPRA